MGANVVGGMLGYLYSYTKGKELPPHGQGRPYLQVQGLAQQADMAYLGSQESSDRLGYARVFQVFPEQKKAG